MPKPVTSGESALLEAVYYLCNSSCFSEALVRRTGLRSSRQLEIDKYRFEDLECSVGMLAEGVFDEAQGLEFAPTLQASLPRA